jgi:hypothetical protein
MALLHVLGRYSLYGRSEQLAGINRLLEGMRSGQAGIGKTALLDAAEEKAAGARVLRRCR